MSIEHQLARITAGTVGFEMSAGGFAELTRDDIKAALGFAQFRVPDSNIGVHIVLWKYCADSISQRVLEKALARMAFEKWFDHAPNDDAPISRGLARRMAQLMLLDMSDPIKVSAKGKTHMAKMVRVDLTTWDKRYAQHYGRLMVDCQRREAGIMSILRRVLSDREE